MLWFRAPEKVYFKKGCLPVALNELKDVMGKKRAFIVTDSFLYKNGYTHVITDRLNEMGLTYTVFSDVQPDPTLANAQAGAKLMRDFEPDVIIAMGGGSAMDAITIVKRSRPRSIKFLCIIAAPEGLKALSEAHPDVHIYCAAVDEKLNEHGYILPGLGDAGDRIFGTM